MTKMLSTAAAAFAAAAAVTLAGPAAVAAPVHVDVRPYVSNGKVVTGGFDDEANVNYPSLRVFGFDFREDPLDPYFIADPGFNAPAGALPAGSELRFTVPGAAQASLPRTLSYWNGAGPVSLAAVPGGESFRLNFGAASNLTIPGGNTAPLDGFAVGTTSAGGGIHRHLNSFLNGPDGNSTPGDGSVAADGIYVLPMRLAVTGSSVLPSDTFYLVFNNGLSEAAHDEAMEFVEANVVPEPATAGLAAVAGVGLLARRRRGGLTA